MKVPIIILNYNTSSDCSKCISFLKKQQGIDIEILVVDNCSSEDDSKYLRSLCEEEQCTLIENLENKGYNAGNNIGLRYAADKGYEYALIANPDMEFPQEDYVARMVEKMEEDEEIVMCGSDIVSPEGIHQNPMKRDGDWRSYFGWMACIFKRKPADTYDFIDNYPKSHYCHKVSGCCLMVRMDFIKSIGFFDEKVFLYCEEAILSKQVQLNGKRMYYIANAQAIHRHIKSEKGNPVRRLKTWRKSRIYYIRRYSGDTWAGRILSIGSLWIYLSLIIGFNRAKKLLK